jgi:hypothetical protein
MQYFIWYIVVYHIMTKSLNHYSRWRWGSTARTFGPPYNTDLLTWTIAEFWRDASHHFEKKLWAIVWVECLVRLETELLDIFENNVENCFWKRQDSFWLIVLSSACTWQKPKSIENKAARKTSIVSVKVSSDVSLGLSKGHPCPLLNRVSPESDGWICGEGHNNESRWAVEGPWSALKKNVDYKRIWIRWTNELILKNVIVSFGICCSFPRYPHKPESLQQAKINSDCIDFSTVLYLILNDNVQWTNKIWIGLIKILKIEWIKKLISFSVSRICNRCDKLFWSCLELGRIERIWR